MWKIISKGQIWQGEIKNKAKDGTYYWVFTTIVPFLNEHGEPEEYVSIRFDITERKAAEQQVLHQDRLASIGLLASSLAHEIGTPLGVIRGRAEYLNMLLGDNPQYKSGLSVIVSQIDRISHLIQSLLKLARSSHSAEMRPLSVHSILKQVIELMEHEFKKNDILFELKISDDLKIKGEQEPFEQVFLNLFVNAVHAIQSAQKEQNRKQGHKITVSSQQTQGQTLIFVDDTGCGIPEKNLFHLFKPFYTTKDIGVGTGLGLAVSYKIIESWGGRINVESTVGQGTRFVITLPLA